MAFDDLSGANKVLSGQYPTGLIDWGTSNWWLSGPYGKFTTKSVSFNGSSLTSASFTLVSAERLVRFDVYNGGSADTTLTVSCPGQPTRQTVVSAGLLATFETNWTGTCTSVTLGVSNGWLTNFDNLTFDVPSAQQTVAFDDIAGQNEPLNGQYPSGLIDWGSGGWWLSGPYGRFTTKSVSFTSTGTSESFIFLAAQRLVRLDLYNGGASATTITISCNGQSTLTFSLAAAELRTQDTGWSGTCTAVTISSTNGWLTNFDNLVVSS